MFISDIGWNYLVRNPLNQKGRDSRKRKLKKNLSEKRRKVDIGEDDEDVSLQDADSLDVNSITNNNDHYHNDDSENSCDASQILTQLAKGSSSAAKS